MGSIFKPLFKYWYWVLLLAVIAALIAVVPGSTRYESRARLLLKLGEDLLQTTVDPRSRSNARIDLAEAINTEVQIMTSYDQLIRVVEELGTDVFLGDSDSDYDAAIAELRKDLNVRSVENSAVIHMTYANKDPALAKQVLDTLINVYLAERKTLLGDNDVDVLGVALEQAEKDYFDARERHETFVRDGESADITSTLAALRDTHKSLVSSKLDTRGQLLEEERKLEILQLEIEKQPLRVSVYSESRANAEVERARERLAELRIEEQQLLISYTAGSQAVTRVRDEMRQLEQVVAQDNGAQSIAVRRTGINPVRERLEIEQAELTVSIAGAKARISALEQQQSETLSEILILEQRDLEHRRLLDDVSSAQTRFRGLEQQYMDSKILADMNTARRASVRVLEKPALPVAAAGIPTKIKLALGALIGLLVGWILAVWTELLRAGSARSAEVAGHPSAQTLEVEPNKAPVSGELPVLGEFRLVS